MQSRPTLRLVTPPADMPVTLDEVKKHLRLESSDDDDLVEGLVGAAVDLIDGKGGYLFRCVMPQAWAIAIDGGFPSCRQGGDDRIVLPLGPVTGIASIVYVDAAGVTQTLDPSQYDFFEADGLDDAYVRPVFGATWPVTRAQPRAVTVTFDAGYAAGTVPAGIRAALMLMIAQLYLQRDEDGAFEITGTVAALLTKYRRVAV